MTDLRPLSLLRSWPGKLFLAIVLLINGALPLLLTIVIEGREATPFYIIGTVSVLAGFIMLVSGMRHLRRSQYKDG
jgi:peptidoglycan/LPS O-acetylase OafA/YrhL